MRGVKVSNKVRVQSDSFFNDDMDTDYIHIESHEDDSAMVIFKIDGKEYMFYADDILKAVRNATNS